MNQAADTGDDEQHHGGELVYLEGEVDLERPDREPSPQRNDDWLMRRLSPELQENAQGDQEGSGQHSHPDDRDQSPIDRLPERQGTIRQEAEQRERDGKPDPMRGDHQPRSKLMF